MAILPAIGGCHVPDTAFRQAPDGYLDVTTFGADPTGATDSTAALQAAIDAGSARELVVWLPAGTYRVSDRLLADQPDHARTNPVVMMGATTDPGRRAVIELAPDSPGFGDPGRRKAVLHFINKVKDGAAFDGFNETGNANLLNQAVVGVDFRIMPGNDGAAALRMQGAEGCTIQDVRIDLTAGGHTGIWGVPGSGGATHKVSVAGGVIGIDTRRIDTLGGGGSQPTVTITGSTFAGQRDVALWATTRGAMVLAGCRIERDRPGPAIRLGRHWEGQPFDGALHLVDCVVDHAAASPQNTVITMAGEGEGRSFLLDNTYVRNAACVWTEQTPAHLSGWIRYKRLAVEAPSQARPWGQPSEPVWVDGAPHGAVLVESTLDAAPPDDLQTRHQWGDDFPTWQSPGAVNVKDLGAAGDGKTDDWAVLQRAIDEHEVVFLPKGDYRVSRTLDLRPDSKLIGVYHYFTSIQAISTLENRFAGARDGEPDRPIIRTADAAGADTILAFLHIRRAWPLAEQDPTPPGNYQLEWRCGGSSLVRHVEVQSNPQFSIRPDLVAKRHYGYNTDDPAAPGYRPIDPVYPQDGFAPGHWGWPCAEPAVQVHGNGGGRWYTFWMHGRQGMRPHAPFLRVEGTRQPLHFYHLHLQQQDSVNHAEFLGARNATIYGAKGEIKGTQVYFENCDNVRLFGHGGMGTPDPARPEPFLFRFVNCSNFLVSGIGDTINEAADRWIGGPFDRWVNARILSWQPILDRGDGRPDVVVPSTQRPILYLRGDPSPVR